MHSLCHWSRHWIELFLLLLPNNTGNATIPQFDDITAVLSIGAVALRQHVGTVFPNHRCTEIHERNTRIQFGTSGHLGQSTVFGTTIRRFHIRSNWWFGAQQRYSICNSNSEIIYAILWVKTFASKSFCTKLKLIFSGIDSAHYSRTVPDWSGFRWLSSIVVCGHHNGIAWIQWRIDDNEFTKLTRLGTEFRRFTVRIDQFLRHIHRFHITLAGGTLYQRKRK